MWNKTQTLALLMLLAACTEKSKFHAAAPEGTAFKQVDANRIEFGDVNVFRIGDGTSGIQSACASELGSYELRGTSYFLVFEALEDATEVNLNIDKLCGVDAEGFTSLTLVKDGSGESLLTTVLVPTDASGQRGTSYKPYPTFTVQKGVYAVKIVSSNTKGKPGPAQAGVDEFDDFIVGKIQLNAPKPLKAIRVYAE